MERPDVGVDEKQFRIGGCTDIMNIGLVSLVGCIFNEVYGVTVDGKKHNFGDYLWDLGSI